MNRLLYEEHFHARIPSIYPQCLDELMLDDVRDLYAYEYKGNTQYYVVDSNRPGHYCVNGFVFTIGIHEFAIKKMKERGEEVPQKKYFQTYAVDFHTRKEANEDAQKRATVL